MIEQKITVIMPAYNSEKYIIEAIESVIKQTYSCWELIIIDDGSTDSTGVIIDNYEEKDNRINSIHTENYGVARARNVGLDKATGEWVLFLDSDDELPKDALYTLLKKSNSVDLVVGNYEKYLGEKEKYRIKKDITYRSIKDIKNIFYDVDFQYYFNACTRKLFKREMIITRFHKDDKYGGDALFMAEVFQYLHAVRFIRDEVYIYKMCNPNSMSHQLHYTDIDVCERLVKIYNDIFNDENITTVLHTYYLHTLVIYLNIVMKQNEIDREQRKKKITSILKSRQLLKSIPVKSYPLSKELRRKVYLILVGDIDLLLSEYDI